MEAEHNSPTTCENETSATCPRKTPAAYPATENYVGISDFRTLLIARHEQEAPSPAAKPMSFALKREPALTDRTANDNILKDLSFNKGGPKDLTRALVLSESFAKN